MKFLSTILATMTFGLVLESGFQNNQALFIDNNESLLMPISRSKRDLIGFNRQANNNFSHRRQWDNRMGMLFSKSLKPCKVVSDINLRRRFQKEDAGYDDRAKTISRTSNFKSNSLP